METKHTPGPWQTHEVGEFITKLAVTDSDGMSILTVVDEDGMTFGAVFNEADASLIATAPELLAALMEMVAAFKDTPRAESNSFDEPPEPVSQWDFEAFITLSQAENVIAKATGA